MMLYTFAFVAFIPMSYAMYGSYALFNAKSSNLMGTETGNPDTVEVSLNKVCFAVHNSINYRKINRILI